MVPRYITAMDQTPLPVALTAAHGTAIEDVNRWRGHCVDLVARMEMAVGDLFDAMAVSGRKMPTVPSTFSQRIACLAKLTAEGAAFTDAGAKMRKTLHHIQPLIDQRNRIVHATSKIWIDPKGDWLWQFRFRPSRKGAAVEEGCITKADALVLEKTLGDESKRLVSLAGNYAKKLRAK